MMSRIAVVVAALAVALTGLARAEETQAPPVAGRTVLGVAVAEMSEVAVGYRASKLIGAKVYNDKNERIGTVGDLVVKTDGTVSFAIVDVGGFLGMGKHHVAIPVGQFSSVNPRIVLPGATKEALKALPPFVYARS